MCGSSGVRSHFVSPKIIVIGPMIKNGFDYNGFFVLFGRVAWRKLHGCTVKCRDRFAIGSNMNLQSGDRLAIGHVQSIRTGGANT